MADYKERFEAMKAAENAMKTTPKIREVRDTKTAATKTERTMPSKEAVQAAQDAAMARKEALAPTTATTMGEPFKKGGKTKCMAKGGSASKRADGCAIRGKTRGRIV